MSDNNIGENSVGGTTKGSFKTIETPLTHLVVNDADAQRQAISLCFLTSFSPLELPPPYFAASLFCPADEILLVSEDASYPIPG